MKWTDYLFTLIFVAIIAGAFYVLLPAYAEYKRAKSEAYQLQQEVLRQEMQVSQLRRQVQALRNDPNAVERVAREKLGWCREDEKVYHFEGLAEGAERP